MSAAEAGGRVRFAPSPTGDLHAGNARTALLNAALAWSKAGTFVLRCDDTDTSREVADAFARQREDLAWLGIEPDLEHHQSASQPAYSDALQRLRSGDHLVADGGALRLRLPEAPITWTDAVQGPMRLLPKHLTAPVLARADGSPTYALASVVDDVSLRMTHILRGADHLTNTAIQLALFDALGAPRPCLAHFSLLTGLEGAPLSKRAGALSLRQLRDAGLEPEPLAAYLLAMGTGRQPDPQTDPRAMAAGFDLSAYSAASPVFALDELARVQERWLTQLGAAAANDALRRRGSEPLPADRWNLFAGALGAKTAPTPLEAMPKLARTADWQALLDQPFAGPIAETERNYCAEAAASLPATWTKEALAHWIDALAQRTGRKGKNLRLPLRLALTGRTDGPPLPDLVAQMGVERVRRRLLGELA